MRLLVTSHTTSLYVMPEVFNRASSVFLDSPVKRLCRNVILRLQPKNLSLIRHRFNEILHFVQNDNIPFQGNCDTVSKPWNDNNVVLLMNFLVNPSITTINDYLSVIARSLRAVAISYSKKKDCFAFTCNDNSYCRICVCYNSLLITLYSFLRR